MGYWHPLLEVFTHFVESHLLFTLNAGNGTAHALMKILFVHERFGALGGAEANILATARELKTRGHSVAVFHGPGTGKCEHEWRETFENRFAFPHSSHTQESATWQSFQPDVIYIHKLADLALLENLISSQVPVIRMVHDHDLYCMRSYKYNYFTRHICERAMSPYCVVPCGAFLARDHEGALPVKWVSYSAKVRELELNRKLDRLVVASQFMKQELRRNGFAADKIEIHAPVPPRGDPGLRSTFSDRNIIVYAGQIIRGKGVDVLLESLAQMSVPFECFIFGDGKDRAACERLSRKLGLSKRVHFKGHVSAQEIAIFYHEASVAVVSSVWPEPFGAVGLEAMRYGVPVVAFDSGGIREWLMDGHNGFLVPWMDRSAFAQRVETLLKDKRLAYELGENGRRVVAEHFDFSNYVTGLETLFSQVTESVHEPVAA
jgi:glycosyltransferase involved in cell wall biosynthesis